MIEATVWELEDFLDEHESRKRRRQDFVRKMRDTLRPIHRFEDYDEMFLKVFDFFKEDADKTLEWFRTSNQLGSLSPLGMLSRGWSRGSKVVQFVKEWLG